MLISWVQIAVKIKSTIDWESKLIFEPSFDILSISPIPIPQLLKPHTFALGTIVPFAWFPFFLYLLDIILTDSDWLLLSAIFFFGLYWWGVSTQAILARVLSWMPFLMPPRLGLGDEWQKRWKEGRVGFNFA